MSDAQAPRWHGLLLLVATLSLVGKLGEALAPPLIAAGYPLCLLALNANDALCLLTSGAVSQHAPLAWLLVSLARRVGEDFLHFSIGRSHGAAAASWIGLNLGFHISEHDEQYRRGRVASIILVALFPSLPPCAVAGYSGISPMTFALADGAMTSVRLLTLRGLLAPFAAEMQAFLGLLQEHRAVAMAGASACALPGALAAGRMVQTALRGRGALTATAASRTC